tara:strand:+ start:364 stop:663 length:300 start_codon:yes stop_codon:yes gene_type:complete
MKLNNKTKQILTAFADGLMGALIDTESSQIEDYWRSYCIDGKYYDINIHARGIRGDKMVVIADAYNVCWDVMGDMQTDCSEWLRLVNIVKEDNLERQPS